MPPVTVRAAASRLGVGYSTLKHWIHDGYVRTTQTPGGHHRIDEAELARLAHLHDAPVSPTAPRAPGGVLVALSGRNRLRGHVEEVRVDGVLGQVRLRIGDQSLTAIITSDAIRELDLKQGDDAVALIKSTEVMVGREAEPAMAATATPRRRRKLR